MWNFFWTLGYILSRKYKYEQDVSKVIKYNEILDHAGSQLTNEQLKLTVTDELDFEMSDLSYDETACREVIMYNLLQQVCKSLDKSPE